MKIAVTYEGGNVYQHFGHSEAFKMYEVEDGKITGTAIAYTTEGGHDAMAKFLSQKGIDVVICGGMGEGAMVALTEAGIEICTGASGNADVAVEAFLSGELTSAGVNCDHHDHEEEGDGCGCGGGCGGCGGGCGGCGGCGGGMRPIMEGKNVMKNVRVHYTGTLNDGTKFDSSYDRGQTLDFVCGVGMMIKGFDQAVANMEVGEVVDVHIMPEDAYGMPDPARILTVETADMPGSEELSVGEQVYLSNSYGQQFPAKVTAKEGTSITFDMNHEMAGKELNFKIELIEVTE